jgi:hypothetical protein
LLLDLILALLLAQSLFVEFCDGSLKSLFGITNVLECCMGVGVDGSFGQAGCDELRVGVRS